MSKLIAYPEQMLPLKEKLKVLEGETVPKWIQQNCDYHSNERLYYTRDLEEMNALCKIAEGYMWENEESHKYVTNPYNTDKEKYKRYPAKMRHYSIIAPILDSFLGEKRAMPHNLTVVSTNNDVHNERKVALQALYQKNLNQDFVNQVNQAGINTGLPERPVASYTEIENNFNATWNDTRSIMGQAAYDYIKENCSLKEQYLEQMYDWLVMGRVVSYKTVDHNDVVREVIDPRNFVCVNKDSRSPFFEDAGGAVCIRYWNAAGIINKFREKLTEDDIRYILELEDKYINDYNSGTVYNQNFIQTSQGTFATVNNGRIPVEHIVWMSVELRKVLTYYDELGVEREMVVSEDYVLEKEKGDISLEDVWENQWWEAWRILDDPFGHNPMNNTNILYLDYGMGEVQRNDIDNTSVCKLPYNGRTWGMRTTQLKSIVKDLLSYQELYDILHYRFELTLAKSKESLLLFPLQAIPKAKGWDTDRFLYSISAFSIAFFDASDPDVKAAMQAMKSVDMALANYMQAYWTLMQNVRDEAWDRVGMNRQRYGQSQASDLKGVTQQAIYQSSLITKNLFETFGDYEECEGNGLLDYSKYAWLDGKKGTYVSSDRRRVFFEINGIDFLESNFDSFMVNSFEEKEKLEQLRQLAQAVAQNTGRTSDVAEILDSTNFAQLKTILNQAEAAQKAYEAEIEKQRNEAQKYSVDKLAEVEDKKEQLKRYEIDQKRASALEVAQTTAVSFNAGADKDADGVDDAQEALDLIRENILKREAFQEEKRSNMAKESLEREKLQTQLKIAKENKNKPSK